MSFKAKLYKKKKLIIYFFLYLSLIVGFIFNEDLSGGGKLDYLFQRHYIEDGFQNGVNNFLFNFYPNSTLSQHSPIYYIVLHSLNSVFKNEIIERLIILHLFLIIPYLMLKCLRIKFSSKNLDFLPLILFISPLFRSTVLWSGREVISISLLSYSLYIVYSYFKKNDLKKIYLAFITLALASYINPIYGLMIIIYFYWFSNLFDIKTLLIFLVFNTILSIPFFWYYINYINFENYNISLSKNLYTNIIFFFSTYFFYILPFILLKKNFLEFLIYLKKNYYFLIFSFLSFYFISLAIDKIYIGGGGFYQILLKFNLSDYIFIISSLGLLGHFFLCNKFLQYNLILLIILILQTCFNFHFFQKYLDLFFIIHFFILLRINYLPKLINNLKFRNNIIIYYLLYYLFTLLFRLN